MSNRPDGPSIPGLSAGSRRGRGMVEWHKHEEEGTMTSLGNLGIFFAGFFGGMGVFFIGCALLWGVSVWKNKRA
jgi:hypothetical protein